MIRIAFVLPLIVLHLATLGAAAESPAKPQATLTVVMGATDASAQELLAAREIRRYMYLRTGTLPPVEQTAALPQEVDVVVVATKDRAIVGTVAMAADIKQAIAALGPQQYLLRTLAQNNRRVLLVVGGDSVGTLYGAYRFAEHLGVRFYLHGDVVPDQRIAWKLPELNDTGKPLFALRGVNPWGCHPFGMDAWSSDDYKVVFSQLAKMRMNFLGVHCYPEGLPFAEPTVWHGLAGDFDARGHVKFSYPSHYFNTLTAGFGQAYQTKETGKYRFGGASLFERDDWAPPVMVGHCPQPATPEGCNEVFNRMAVQFRDAFAFARQLGVKTCLGTETPLTMPGAVRQRLQAQGKNPADPAAVREVYQGTFRRIMASHPLDYYWLWTPEGWTWGDNNPQQYKATVADIKLAIEALKNVNAPFKLVTAGWVLGPAHDRAAFDNDLPKDVPMSAISRNTGAEAVDPAFGRITGREKWAIPWLESDVHQGLAGIQLYAGRMRRDAADAAEYGCTGLMGLQWRTDILAPNASALAQAAWDQNPGFSSKINCGGGAYMGWLADAGAVSRDLPCGDFYADWALANFGSEAAAGIAKVFTDIDGRVPLATTDGCPVGALTPDATPWAAVAARFAFVEALEQLRPAVRGAGNLDRCDYWLNTFKYYRSLAQVREYAAVDFQHVARGIYTAALPPVRAAGIEYYIEVTTGEGQQLMFPPTAPRLNQTVAALPQASGSVMGAILDIDD